MDAIQHNSTITINELAVICGVSIKSDRTTIDKLKQKGLLSRIGPDKGGYWQINKN